MEKITKNLWGGTKVKVNDKINILIADDNYEFGDTLKTYLENDEELDVIGIARDGEEAYENIINL